MVSLVFDNFLGPIRFHAEDVVRVVVSVPVGGNCEQT